MFLAKMNYREVEEYLKTSDTIIIPVGSLENHGLHLPLGTDTLIPDKIAQLLDAGVDLNGVAVAVHTDQRDANGLHSIFLQSNCTRGKVRSVAKRR